MLKRILIVDDEPAIRDMVAFALRKDNYEPVHAGDAREAQEAIAQKVPDLILLDLQMPELDGIGVWYDRNSNGVSEPGEVHPCGQAGVVRIAARAQRGPDGVLTHPGGVSALTSRLGVPSFKLEASLASTPFCMPRAPTRRFTSHAE